MSAPIVSFKAGRAYRRDDNSKWVDPVEGRGLVYLQEEDGLLHFYYKDLVTSSTTEPAGLDLLIFPGDATFSLLPNKRIHVLKFNSSSHVHFFWAQDVDQSKDEDNAKRINGLIGGEEEEEEEQGAMEVEGPPATTPAPASTVNTTSSSTSTSAPASSSPEALLRSLMAGLPGAGLGSLGGEGGRQLSEDYPAYSLLSLLPFSTLSLISPSSIPSLIPFLPTTVPQTETSLQQTLQHPEFKRAVVSFERALRSGGLTPLMSGLGLEEGAGRGLEEFVEAVQKQGDKSKNEDGESDKMEE